MTTYGVVRDRTSVERVRRNLFGKFSGVSFEDTAELSSLHEDQAKFREKWGFDVITDTAIPDGNFEWQQLDFDELPDAFKRMGGCRPRRYSNTSTGSTSGESQRSGSFSSTITLTPPGASMTPVDAEASRDHHTPVKTKEAKALITDYLQSQAKRTRCSKDRQRQLRRLRAPMRHY